MKSKLAIAAALIAAFVAGFFALRSDDCAEMELERARNMAAGASYPFTDRDPWTCR